MRCLALRAIRLPMSQSCKHMSDAAAQRIAREKEYCRLRGVVGRQANAESSTRGPSPSPGACTIPHRTTTVPPRPHVAHASETSYPASRRGGTAPGLRREWEGGVIDSRQHRSKDAATDVALCYTSSLPLHTCSSPRTTSSHGEQDD